MKSSLALRRWHEMSPREQQVWTCTFMMSQYWKRRALKAAELADIAVTQLRELDIDEADVAPEYVAARSGVYLTEAEFFPWYRVALHISSRHRLPFREPTVDEIGEAYERYRRGRGDFY